MVTDLDLEMKHLVTALGAVKRQDSLPDDVTLLMVRR
jgi:hypothetical protein